MKSIIFLFTLVGLLGGVACGEKLDTYYDYKDSQFEDGVDISYSVYIEPILDAYCIYCHGSNVVGADRNNAPEDVNLDSYGAAKAAGVRANNRIQTDQMPPNEPLTVEAKDFFQQWVDDGMPE